MAPGATPSERADRGRRARKRRPRSRPGEWSAPGGRTDPIDVLEGQAITRVPELVPLRYGRMVASPFAFFRGAAAVMARDLAAAGSTGLEAQLCGDAHLSNFGGFAAPDRQLVFDINDFDETHPGPFEWDVQRLVASIEIAARASDMDDRERSRATRRTGRAYRLAMRSFADMTDLAVWYLRLDVEHLDRFLEHTPDPQVLARLRRAADKAKRKDRFKALDRLIEDVDGEPRFVSDPPLLVPAEEVLGLDVSALDEAMRELLVDYRGTLAPHEQRLIEGYVYRRLARKVVGVGSVGLRAWVVLLTGRDDADPLFLQVKQAEASVLEPLTRTSAFDNHGQRVVYGQRLLQAASDVFLGWNRFTGADGVTRDFYVRQLWDWKASADIGSMSAQVLAAYGEICGWTLARAHARSGDRIAISSYLGGGDAFDVALAAFAVAYADQNERDHAGLVDAIASGRVQALEGV